jgi:enoyl-CoA hydratase
MCDVIIAADTCKFGQPEIKLGVIPGMAELSGHSRGWQGEGDGSILTGR